MGLGFSRYFFSSFLVAILGCMLATAIGFYYHGSWQGALQTLLLTVILAVLEVSISFDNAVVNAAVLKKMNLLWQRRFLTWGMGIAVFGMRILFPLLFVAVLSQISPWEAFRLAVFSPQKYTEIMLGAHHQVSSFGGAFLMLVALKYFFDTDKDRHWIRFIEKPLVKMGKLEAIEVGIVLVMIALASHWVEPTERLAVLYSGIFGILSFLIIDGIGVFLQNPGAQKKSLFSASMGMFLYLEILDATFSFDGVVGAFAMTNNLFVIGIGLGIGAMFVRSLTVLMVERKTLEAFIYIEHGAFYAIAILAIIMFLGTVIHVSEVVTGLLGAFFVGLSVYSSIKKMPKPKEKN